MGIAMLDPLSWLEVGILISASEVAGAPPSPKGGGRLWAALEAEAAAKEAAGV